MSGRPSSTSSRCYSSALVTLDLSTSQCYLSVRLSSLHAPKHHHLMLYCGTVELWPRMAVGVHPLFLSALPRSVLNSMFSVAKLCIPPLFVRALSYSRLAGRSHRRSSYGRQPGLLGCDRLHPRPCAIESEQSNQNISFHSIRGKPTHHSTPSTSF
jgi:hypothetical protein